MKKLLNEVFYIQSFFAYIPLWRMIHESKSRLYTKLIRVTFIFLEFVKEHALFLAASFTSANLEFTNETIYLKKNSKLYY